MERVRSKFNVNGFSIIVECWKNHLGVEFPHSRMRKTRNKKDVKLTMKRVCNALMRYFKFVINNGKTCVMNVPEGTSHERTRERLNVDNVEIEERSVRRVVIRLQKHEIKATASVDGLNKLILTFPDGINSDFTFGDLCRIIPKKFAFDPKYKRTRIVCIRDRS